MNVVVVEVIGSIAVIIQAALRGRRILSKLRLTPMTSAEAAQAISGFKSGLMIWCAFVIFFAGMPFYVGGFHSWLLTCALGCSILLIYVPSLRFLYGCAHEF